MVQSAVLYPENGSSAPVLAVDGGGNVLAIWGGLAARYTKATNAWGSMSTLFSNAVGEAQAVLDDAGDATVMWVRYQPQESVAVRSTTRPRPDAWGPRGRCPRPDRPVHPCLAVDAAGTVTASWAESSGNVTGATAFAARRVRGQPWATTVALRDGGGSCVAEASDGGEVTVLWSDLKSTRWSLNGAEAVAAPTGLQAGSTSSIWNHEAEIGAPIRVNWSPSSTGLPVTGYRLEAGTGPDLRNLADVDVGAATQLNATVPAVRRIVLRVRAVSGATDRPPSSEFVFLVYGVCPPIETTPTGLAQTVVGNIVTLSWQAAQGAGSYVLEAGSAPGLANLVSANIGGARRIHRRRPTRNVPRSRARGEQLRRRRPVQRSRRHGRRCDSAGRAGPVCANRQRTYGEPLLVSGQWQCAGQLHADWQHDARRRLHRHRRADEYQCLVH